MEHALKFILDILRTVDEQIFHSGGVLVRLNSGPDISVILLQYIEKKRMCYSSFYSFCLLQRGNTKIIVFIYCYASQEVVWLTNLSASLKKEWQEVWALLVHLRIIHFVSPKRKNKISEYCATCSRETN